MTRRVWARPCRRTRPCRRVESSKSSGARRSATPAPARSSIRPRSTTVASMSAPATARSSGSARLRVAPQLECRPRVVPADQSRQHARRQPRPSPRPRRSRSTRSASTTPLRSRRRCSRRARRRPALPATLAAGDQLTVPLTFAPAAPGLETGTLTANTNEGAVDLPLDGLGVAPTVPIGSTPPSVDFGTHADRRHRRRARRSRSRIPARGRSR